MVEVYRNANAIQVGYLKSVLEAEGILCLIRNESIAMTEIPIPAFYPALNVMNDEDAPVALKLIEKSLKCMSEETNAEVKEDIPCPHCAEENPANFGNCWSCCGEL